MALTERKYNVEMMKFITEYIKQKMDTIQKTISSENEIAAHKIITLAFRTSYELKFGYYPPMDVMREFHAQLRQEIEFNL